MANNDTGGNTKPTKLYRLLSGSITRYEGTETKDGARKVVTYEANGDAAGNQVWLTEKEAAAVGSNKLEEVHGAVRNDQDDKDGKIAAPPAAASLTGAPAGGPVEGEGDAEVNDGGTADNSTSTDGGGAVNVGETMATSGTSSNPAVDRVLAKKAAATK
jgi:hypothetical protein